MSNLVAEYIRRGLEQKPKSHELPPLPSYDGGPFLIDVSDRDSLYGLLDEDKGGTPIEHLDRQVRCILTS
jgi:hypothetical protein